MQATIQKKKSHLGPISIGLAMFSMFFGAGNIIFPIGLGQSAGNQNIYAILGLIVTAVIVPFLGLASMLTFNGDYRSFFGRIGKVPGMLVAGIIMALIGPFGAMPRCITLSHSTFEIYAPNVSLWTFSVVACIVIFAMSFKKNKVVDVLGLVLTPVLLISLAVIILRGLFDPPMAATVSQTPTSVFYLGLTEGYNTMDLFAAFFFSIVIIPAFKEILGDNLDKKLPEVGKLSIESSMVGMILLAAIYAGMSFVASFYSSALVGVPLDKQLGFIANFVLGPYAGLVANLAVSLACLTTAITLAVVFAEFVRVELLRERIPYAICLAATLVIAFFFSQLGFTGIVNMLVPILFVMCPALIVLTIVNLLYRFVGFPYVKTPVFATFIATLALNYLS